MIILWLLCGCASVRPMLAIYRHQLGRREVNVATGMLVQVRSAGVSWAVGASTVSPATQGGLRMPGAITSEIGWSGCW